VGGFLKKALPRGRASALFEQACYNAKRGIIAIESMEDLIRKLREEIAALETELRIELPREILKARAHGDLSENAEYHAAKERQGYVNARLGQLNARLRQISMIDLSKVPHDRAGLGSTVTVLDIHREETIIYKLVTSEDVDVAKGLISTSSPIGRGLLGKKVGDTVKVQIPGGVREMEITELITIHQTNR
jgi:transcription elongation factor GreA